MFINVGLACGSSNINDHERNISNVELHLVQQLYNGRIPPEHFLKNRNQETFIRTHISNEEVILLLKILMLTDQRDILVFPLNY